MKGCATHERDLFDRVTQARAAAMGAKTVGEHGEAENMLTSTLKTLFAVSENYPQLKASENFLELQKELRDTEDKIQASRRFYNGTVRDYNTKSQSFPDPIFAKLFSFSSREFFDLEEEAAKEPVQVKF